MNFKILLRIFLITYLWNNLNAGLSTTPVKVSDYSFTNQFKGPATSVANNPTAATGHFVFGTNTCQLWKDNFTGSASSMIVYFSNLGGFGTPIKSIAWSPKGNYFIVGVNGKILIFTASTTSGYLGGWIDISPSATITSIAWNPSETGFAVAYGSTVKTYTFNAATSPYATLSTTITTPSTITSIAFRNDSDLIVANGNIVSNYTGTTAVITGTLNTTNVSSVQCIAYNTIKSIVAACKSNGVIQIGSFASTTGFTSLGSATLNTTTYGTPTSTAWSLDGEFLAVTTSTGYAQVYKVTVSGNTATLTYDSDPTLVATGNTYCSWFKDLYLVTCGGSDIKISRYTYIPIPATPSPTTAFKWQLDSTTGNVWFWDKTKWNLASGDTFKQIAVTSSGIVCALSASTTNATGGYAVKIRTGATTTNPFGTAWEILNGGYLNTITANGLYVWGVNSSNNTFYISGIDTPSTAKWTSSNPPVLLNNTKPLTVDSSGAINGIDINGTIWTITNGSTFWQMPDLNNALSAIGTTYTSANLGTSADAWPTQKTLMAIVKYTGFDNINFVNNPSTTNSIYTKIKGFYDARTDATLSSIKDLLTATSGKKFLSSGAIAPATTSQTADITTWLNNVNNALSEATNKINFTKALNEITGIKFLPEIDTPLLQKLQALVDNTTYNNLTYLVDYPTPTNSIYTKIDYFYKKRGTFPLTDIQKLLTNAKDKNFLSATQKTDLTTYSTQVAKEIAYYTTLKTTAGETSFIFDPSTVTENTYAAFNTAAYSDKWAVTTPNYIEVRFKAEAFSDIHIRFASSTNPTDYIQVIFGGNTNTKSWARYAIGEAKTTIIAETDNVIPTGVSDYWVKISGTTLTYGTGTNVVIGTTIIPDAAPKNLKYVGFGGYSQRVFYQNISIKTDDSYAQYAETTRVNGILTGLDTLTFTAPSTLYDVQLSALQTLVTSVDTNLKANTSLDYASVQAAFWTALTNLHAKRPTTDKAKLTALKTWYATLTTPNRTKLLASDKNFTTMNSDIDVNIAAADTAQLKSDLNTALTNIGTNYTITNIGEAGDIWPTKKTMFAVINNPSFDTTYQGENGGNLIYAKLVGFYDNRANIGFVKLSDGFSGLLDVAQSKTFLTDNQKKGVSDRIAIIGLEVGLTAAFKTLNSTTDKLTAIKTFLSSYANDTRNLRAKRAALLK